MQKQFFEGKLADCKGANCNYRCCNDDHGEEWANEYFLFHEKLRNHLESVGINIEFRGDRVKFLGCSDGRGCKFIKHSLNRNVDPRPIDCKIYPFSVDWNNIDFGKKIVSLTYWDLECPLVRSNKIPKKFKSEVEAIIKRDFAVLFYGTRFDVKFPPQTLACSKN